MGTRKANHHRKGGLIAVVADKTARLLPHEAVDRIAPRNFVDDRALVFVIAGVFVSVEFSVAALLQKVIVIITDLQPPFVFGGNSVLKSQIDVPRIKVHLADRGGVIALLGQGLGPSLYTARSEVRA